MKKIALFLALLIALLPVITALGEQSGDFEYELDASGNAIITGINFRKSTMKIPSKIAGHPVTALNLFSASWSSQDRVTVEIPNSVVSINGAGMLNVDSVAKYVVSSDHEVFTAVDRVLYNKKDKMLIAYPPASTRTTYEIPQGIKAIGDCAFSDSRSLTSIKIPDSVNKIGSSAFEGCTSLKSINLPDGVTAIENDVFSGCSALASINLPKDLTRIGDAAFSGAKLLDIKIPDRVVQLGNNPFAGCASIKVAANHPVFAAIDGVLFDKQQKKLIGCPNSIRGAYKVPQGIKTIGMNAFARNELITSVILPESVTTIEDYAFWECKALKAIEIPDSVTEIGWDAFSGCTSLTSVKLPNSLETINGNTFNYCTSLTSVVLPEGLTLIDAVAFASCKSLKSIVIPNNVTEIGFYAFIDCTSLTSVVIPDSVYQIGEDAFFGCSKLTLTVGEGSYAETYAKENNLRYVYAEGEYVETVDDLSWLND